MKRGRRFTGERIVRILHEADRAPAAEVAKRHGVSDLSIYAWRKNPGHYGHIYPAVLGSPLIKSHRTNSHLPAQLRNRKASFDPL